MSERKPVRRNETFDRDRVAARSRFRTVVSRRSYREIRQETLGPSVLSFTGLFKILIRGDKVTGGHAWLHSSRRVYGFYDDTATDYLDSEHL